MMLLFLLLINAMAGVLVGGVLKPLDFKPFNCEFCMAFHLNWISLMVFYYTNYGHLYLMLSSSLAASYIAMILWRYLQQLK